MKEFHYSFNASAPLNDHILHIFWFIRTVLGVKRKARAGTVLIFRERFFARQLSCSRP